MAKRIDVRSILEGYFNGLSFNNIARTRHASKHSVQEVVMLANLKDYTSMECIADMSDDELYSDFFPDKTSSSTVLEEVDYNYVHKELNRTGVTLKLLWNEYVAETRLKGCIPASYITYTRGYAEYIGKKGFASHLEHKAGDRIEVDWSGPTMHYTDLKTGKRVTVYLFVSDCVSSRLAYVEPTLSMDEQNWLQCHINMWNYFGGVSRVLVCDNLLTGVQRHPREGEIVLTKEYELLMEHYCTGIIPCEVKSPRQKNSVENTVYNIAMAIIAPLRNTEFTSFNALRKAVREKLEEFNNKPFEKRYSSRRVDFEGNEREALKPLPATPFEIGKWAYGRKVQVNSHVVFEKNWYSCPHKYIGETVDIKATPMEIQIFHENRLVKRHMRLPSGLEYRYKTDKSDMPKGTEFQEWDSGRILRWAESIGPNTMIVVRRILGSRQVPEQAFIPALAVLHMTEKYGKEKVEMASGIALAKVESPRHHHLKSILVPKKAEMTEENAKTALGILKGEEYFEKYGDK